MAMTKLTNLMNPEVMGDWVSEHLEKEMKFSPLCRVDFTLAGRAGDTVTVPKYAYIGDAGEVAEGDAITISQLTASSEAVTVKKAGNGVELTDEALLSGYGDPLGEAGMQLTLSIAGKVDGDVLAALTKIGAEMTYTASESISADVIADALVKLGEKEGGEKVLVVAPAQLAQLRKSEGWLKATDVGAMRLVSGAVGMIHGCQVIVSDKITASGGNFTNYIVMPGALVLFLKKDTEVESQRDIVHKSTVVTADKYYAVYLANESKAVKLVCKETAASAPSGTGGGSGD